MSLETKTPETGTAPLTQPESVSHPERRRRKLLHRVLGRMSIDSPVPSYTYRKERAPLPETYSYTDHVTRTEIADLMNKVDWEEVNPDSLLAEDKRDKNNNRHKLRVGVRDADKQLVGYGVVLYKGRRGELCDFVVSPDQQGQGIGRAIIEEQLAEAERFGIKSLYIPYLEETNTLRSYYEEKGFTETPAGELVRGPDPRSISGMQPKPVKPVA